MSMILEEGKEEKISYSYDASIKKSAIIPPKVISEKVSTTEWDKTWLYDVFIVHSGTDKRKIVGELYDALEVEGLRCFLDEFSILPGEDSERKIITSLLTSRLILVLLTPEIIERQYPAQEISFSLERLSREPDKVIIIPLFYSISPDDIRGKPKPFSSLANICGIRADSMFQREYINTIVTHVKHIKVKECIVNLRELEVKYEQDQNYPELVQMNIKFVPFVKMKKPEIIEVVIPKDSFVLDDAVIDVEQMFIETQRCLLSPQVSIIERKESSIRLQVKKDIYDSIELYSIMKKSRKTIFQRPYLITLGKLKRSSQPFEGRITISIILDDKSLQSSEISPHFAINLRRHVSQPLSGIFFPYKDISLIETVVKGKQPKQFFISSGKKWLYKPYSGQTYRAHVEQAVNMFSKLVGLNTGIDVYLFYHGEKITEKSGNEGCVQNIIPGKCLEHTELSKFSTLQIKQLQREHVIDYMVSNHDGHQENILLTDNGDIIGIDKGQSFKYFGEDILSIEYNPNLKTYGIASYWNLQLENCVRKGYPTPKLDDDLISFIKRVQSITNEQMVNIFDRYVKCALSAGIKWGDISDSKGFFEKLNKRRDTLLKDMEAFYSKLNHNKTELEIFLDRIGDLPKIDWDSEISLRAFKGELIHKLLEYNKTCKSLSITKDDLSGEESKDSPIKESKDSSIKEDLSIRESKNSSMITQYPSVIRIRFSLIRRFNMIYFSGDKCDKDKLFCISLILEGINLAVMMGDIKGLDYTDISQSFLGLACNEKVSTESKWIEVFDIYYDLVSDSNIRKFLSLVPQNPQNETFDEKQSMIPLMSKLSEIKDIKKYSDKIELFLKRCSESDLNNEGYWEFHTRIQKFLILYLLMKYEGIVIGTIPELISKIDSDKINTLWNKITKMREKSGIFDELLKRHTERAKRIENIVSLFTSYFPTMITIEHLKQIIT